MIHYVLSTATFSDDRKYRYDLTRVWDEKKPRILFILLNPSTADEIKSDPTVTRCINYAYDWNFGRIDVTNVFALRSTDPKKLKIDLDPVGPENNKYIEDLIKVADMVIGAWGTHGTYMRRNDWAIEMTTKYKDLYCLKKTKHGIPSHPLYLPKDLRPILFKKRDAL